MHFALVSALFVVPVLLAARHLVISPHHLLHQHVTPDVPWASSALFIPHTPLWDDFSSVSLDTSKWDEHALPSPDTGCPHWNGPIYPTHPHDSTLYPTTSNPSSSSTKQLHLQSLVNGELRMRVETRPESFFAQREYYCDNSTFTCNHNPSIPCYATDAYGNPLLDSSGKTFKAVVHDKCKREPFCIPHHRIVQGKDDRQYKRVVSTHIATKETVKYGFVETRLRLSNSPAVAAVWMHNDDMTEGWCRYRYSAGDAASISSSSSIKTSSTSSTSSTSTSNSTSNRTSLSDSSSSRTSTTPTDRIPQAPSLECPSATRSRRWQEIDLVEAMNVGPHARGYYPNVHAFAMYKGEFSSSVSSPDASGGMGGGPIIISGVFGETNPSFADIPAASHVDNDWHWDPGSVAELQSSWADQPHTIGMYWSPNEIRFYVDGKETARLKNNLIHQPMHIDVSYGLNTPWAEQSPTEDEMRRSVAKVDYVRTWKVLTKHGVEPPADLPLGDDMTTGFSNIYGDQLYGVFDRFPANDSRGVEKDNQHLLASMPSTARFTTTASASASATTDTSAHVKRSSVSNTRTPRAVHARGKPNIEDVDNNKQVTSHDSWARAESVEDRRALAGYTDVGLLGRLLASHYEPAGGAGNVRFNARRQRLSTSDRMARLASTDRHAGVKLHGAVDVIPDAARTVFDVSDPNAVLAGWAMRGNGSRTDRR